MGYRRRAHYGAGSLQTPTTAAVPEPTATVLALAALGLVAARRRFVRG
ncbi:MAG: PEP-CTERM sorting domain-containing protein [Pirellulales bacterium]|nr:PEP-CTERM sorting domain-containing protein [Pirellulales bacterium]